MSLSASRAVLRQSRTIGRSARRFESTSAKATEAAKDTASKAANAAKDYKSKASEGLSKVASAAGPAFSATVDTFSSTVGKIGGRTGRLIGFVQRQIPPTIYYARVGLELSKLVFQGQKMNPPPVATFQSYLQSVLKGIRKPGTLFNQATASPKTTPEGVLHQVRNVNSAQLVAGAVIFAEVLGFFTVGEMIGRFKLVGYHGEKAEAHH